MQCKWCRPLRSAPFPWALGAVVILPSWCVGAGPPAALVPAWTRHWTSLLPNSILYKVKLEPSSWDAFRKEEGGDLDGLPAGLCVWVCVRVCVRVCVCGGGAGVVQEIWTDHMFKFQVWWYLQNLYALHQTIFSQPVMSSWRGIVFPGLSPLEDIPYYRLQIITFTLYI